MPSLNEVQSFLILYVPKALLAIIIILVALYLGRMLRKLVMRALQQTGADVGVPHLLGQLPYWAVVAAGMLVALGLFVDLTALLAGLGIAGFALTFAFQDVLKNFVAGIILLVQRPFLVGDYVALVNYEGTITAVNSRSTLIHTADGLTVLLPNATILDNPIVNYTRTPHRRIEVHFSLPYNADLALVRELSLKAVEAVPSFLATPAPDILLENATGGVTLRVRLWIDTLKTPASNARDEALSLVYDALKAGGIEFRYPRQEVSVFMEQPAQCSRGPAEVTSSETSLAWAAGPA